jgi:hypothetical protein
MKAITLWQPWASLLACGAKKFETRSWETSYRGPIAIHAAAKSIKSVLKECFPCGDYEYHPSHKARPEFLNAVGFALLHRLDDLPFGAIIAIAEMVGCHKMVLDGKNSVACVNPPYGIYYPTEQELMFGNWTPGHYAWEFANMTILPEPIPAKGGQRLWNWKEAET